jgi:hypothetical protein
MEATHEGLQNPIFKPICTCAFPLSHSPSISRPQVESPSQWPWRRQLRYYSQQDGVAVCMAEASFQVCGVCEEERGGVRRIRKGDGGWLNGVRSKIMRMLCVLQEIHLKQPHFVCAWTESPLSTIPPIPPIPPLAVLLGVPGQRAQAGLHAPHGQVLPHTDPGKS